MLKNRKSGGTCCVGGHAAVGAVAAVGELRILHVISVSGWDMLRGGVAAPF